MVVNVPGMIKPPIQRLTFSQYYCEIHKINSIHNYKWDLTMVQHSFTEMESSRVIDASILRIEAGYDTIRIAINMRGNSQLIRALENLVNTGKRMTDGSIVNVNYKKWSDDNGGYYLSSGERLSSKYGYVYIEFEPGSTHGVGGSDLIPFSLWNDYYYNHLQPHIEEVLDYPNLFKQHKVRLSRFDLAFDVYYDDPECYLKGIDKIPRDMRLPVTKNPQFSLRWTSKSGSSTNTIYDRGKKSKSKVLRYEMRRMGANTVDSALRLLRIRKAVPEDLSDRERIMTYLGKQLKRYKIYPGVDIVPLDALVSKAKRRPTIAKMQDYPNWYREKGSSRAIGTWRRAYGMIVGSFDSGGPIFINLNESMTRAANNSWVGAVIGKSTYHYTNIATSTYINPHSRNNG